MKYKIILRSLFINRSMNLHLNYRQLSFKVKQPPFGGCPNIYNLGDKKIISNTSCSCEQEHEKNVIFMSILIIDKYSQKLNSFSNH